jgi:hypothetical protein
MVNIPTASTGGEHGGGVCHLQSRYEDGEIVAFGHGSSKFESGSYDGKTGAGPGC